MNAVYDGRSTPAWVAPPGIKTVTLDKQTGREPTSSTTEYTTDIFPSWYTPMSATDGTSAVIDKVSGKLATSCTPPLARETVYASEIQPEILPNQNEQQYENWLVALRNYGYDTSGSTIPTSYDDVHNCSDTMPSVSISGAQGGGPYNLSIDVTSGTFTANQLQVYFDSNLISTQSINGSGTYTVNYSPTSNGSHTFKAVVTDAGLYQATTQQTVNVTSAAGNSGPGNQGSATFAGQSPAQGSTVPRGQVQFSWSGDGAQSYTVYINGQNYGSTGSTSLTVPLNRGTYSWYVEDNNGVSTDTSQFTVQ